ncbi:hypothetical protein EMCRGX_G016905 [Ephydatia muelleri]|eukprot:Em0008g470a
MMDLRSRGKALHAKGDSNKRALMGKEILSSPSYQQFIQKRVKEDEERRRIQKDSQPPPRLRASPQRKETHTQQKQAQNAKIKPLMQNPVLAPNQDVTQGAEVDVNEVAINRKVIPIADSEESREERGNEIERTGDNGLVRESEDSIGAHPDREDTVVRVNHGDEEVQGNGGSSESVGNRTESDVGRSERGLGARADWDRLMAGELKKCLHKEHNQILKQVKIVDQQTQT